MSPWYACAEPERPTDPDVLWHYEDCTGCRVKAAALAMQHPDNSHVTWLNDLIRGRSTTVKGDG